MPIEDAIESKNAFGLQKDSELLEIFNYHLLKMKETGFLAHTFRSIVDPQSKMKKSSNNNEGQASAELGLGFTTVSFPFIFLLMGIIFSIAISAYEYFTCSYENVKSCPGTLQS